MNKTTILNKLLKIQETGNYNNINDIINELKIDVFSETKNFTASKRNAQKKALSFLKSNKQERLKKAQIIDNIQYFTDSFIAFKIIDPYELPTFRNDQPLESIVSLFNNAEKNKYTINYDLNIILKKIKSKQYDKNKCIDFFETEKGKIYFDPMKLKTIVEILNTTDLTIKCSDLNYRPILFIDEKTGNNAILCPVRHTEEKETC